MAMTRGQKLNLLWLAVAVAGVATGFVMGAMEDNEALELGVFLALALVVGVGGSIVMWRLLDEAQREAHKTAWFWGGSMGMLLGLVAELAVMTFAPDLVTSLNPGGEPGDYVRIGLVGILTAQVAGYGLAWAWWWWRHR